MTGPTSDYQIPPLMGPSGRKLSLVLITCLLEKDWKKSHSKVSLGVRVAGFFFGGSSHQSL